MILFALIAVSCSKDDVYQGRDLDYAYGRDLKHGKIVLGERLQNPYTTENMTKALCSVYPVKAGRVELEATDLYVRFLPQDREQYELLEDMGIEPVDHPLDYDILVEGDWYHDPDIPEGEVTWQYAVVPSDFVFPDVKYEIIDECYISEHDPATRAGHADIDWMSVEREAYVLTGNASMLSETHTKSSDKVKPSGRMTIVDKDAFGGKPVGVAGVRIMCNSFVKYACTYTDRDGYYTIPKEFSSKLRYRMVFRNEKGFSIGFNLVLLPASVSTLGRSGPEGVSMTITQDSEEKLFKRCVVNNAAYEFHSRCVPGDLNISSPPADLRIWIFYSMKSSSAVMMHHGAFVSSDLIGKYLGVFAELLQIFLPDITIGVSGKDSYREIYSSTCHELSHACHFVKAGQDFWNRYIKYIMTSNVQTGGMVYGDGTAADAGVCEIGEMWAYYMESKMYKDRYGGQFPTFGTSYWFYPQIFRYLDERGIECSDIFSVLGSDTDSRSGLKERLIGKFPEKRTMIEQVFNRYQ